MTIYSDLAGVANELLAVSGDTFGQLGAIRRTVTANGASTYPLEATATATDYPALLALFPVRQRDIDGTFVKEGDWTALVATTGLTITPTTSDKLVCTEGVLTIVDAGKFAPGGTITHYKMLVRK